MNTPVYDPGEMPGFLVAYAQAPAMERLQNVGMHCGCEYTSFPFFRALSPYSRFDHSLSCASLVWRFTGDMAQSLSALFHDIATPVFAHTVDFLRGDHLAQEATESGTEDMIAASPEIRALLAHDGIPLSAVTDYHLYPVADNPSPRLSCDRLEYTLSNLVHFGFGDPALAQRCLNDLTVSPNEDGQPELTFRSPDLCVTFARLALSCSRVYTADEDRYSMQILSEVLERALRLGVITLSDLSTTEPRVISILESHPDTRQLWRSFRSLSRLVTAETDAPVSLRRVVPAKKRYIDPLCPGHGRASALSSDFRADLTAYLAQPQTHWVCAV